MKFETCGMLIAGLVAATSCNKTDMNKPNVVLINLDDAGLGDFSCTGAVGYRTPNIDRLFAEGVNMTNFYAVQPISGASRAGLMTGCYPNRIGFAYALNPNCEYGINPDEDTMGELLQDGGYATAIFGKWHLGDNTAFLPLQHGFDEYYGLPYSNDMWPFHPQYEFPDLPLIEGNEIIGLNTDQTRLTTDYTEHSVDFIRRNAEAGKPFFLYLAHSMPHVPLAVSDKFKGKSDAGLWGDVMMELDWSVGEVIKTLDETGELENTLVIITSDNGPWINYGNHAGNTRGGREAKATTFNGGLRVPCAFYWKGKIEPGRVYNGLMSNIDLLPTIMDICSSPMPEKKIDGVSMAEVITEGSDRQIRENLCFYYHKNSLEAVTDGRFKLVFPHSYTTYEAFLPGNDGMPGELGQAEVTEPELYDLRRDAGERVNVISQHPDVYERLMMVAEDIRSDLGDDSIGLPGKNRRSPKWVSDIDR